MDHLVFLQQWYSRQCDGDWEHSYGVRIETLDNPGWALTIDLAETELAGRAFMPISRNLESALDWIAARVENGRFEARGGPSNLPELLATFAGWAEPQDSR
jgi:hypothetical protein